MGAVLIGFVFGMLFALCAMGFIGYRHYSYFRDASEEAVEDINSRKKNGS